MPIKKCPTPTCDTRIDGRARQCVRCRHAHLPIITADGTVAPTPVLPPPLQPAEQVQFDREKKRLSSSLEDVRRRYAESLETIERLEREVHAVSYMREGLETYTIEPSTPSHTGEATAIVMASDWHVGATVGAEVGGLNTFDREIAGKRIATFFRKAHSLTRMLEQDITIPTMVLALLGDFIHNIIHEEFEETNDLSPIHSIVETQNHLASGIQFLLDNTTRKLVIPCHSGNHARTTRTTRFGSENGHSLEFLMYQHLAAYFRHEPRVTFIIPEGPHSYLDIYGRTVRFQHGHMVKYGGGVGGIYIPVHKAIAKWNEARRADLDLFGHFHQLVDGGNFVCNGSLVGYDSFALSIKASYEKPKQALILLDKKRGRTALWPILL